MSLWRKKKFCSDLPRFNYFYTIKTGILLQLCLGKRERSCTCGEDVSGNSQEGVGQHALWRDGDVELSSYVTVHRGSKALQLIAWLKQNKLNLSRVLRSPHADKETLKYLNFQGTNTTIKWSKCNIFRSFVQPHQACLTCFEHVVHRADKMTKHVQVGCVLPGKNVEDN